MCSRTSTELKAASASRCSTGVCARHRRRKPSTAFEALIAGVASDVSRRERAQMRLAGLRSPAAYNVHRLAGHTRSSGTRWHVVFPIWTAAVVLTMSMAFFWPVLVLRRIFGFVVNRVILVIGRLLLATRSPGSVNWVRCSPRRASWRHSARQRPRQSRGRSRRISPSLRRLGRIARWVSRDPLATDTLTFIALEFLNMLFLMDANALYFAVRELRVHAPHLVRVIEAVGEIDAAIAVASFRSGTADGFGRPSGRRTRASSFADLRHPLVEQAVPNSIALAPPHGVL